MRDHCEPARESLLILELDRVIQRVRDVRSRRYTHTTRVLGIGAQKPVQLYGSRAQHRTRVGDYAEERIGYLCVQRGTADSPVNRVQFVSVVHRVAGGAKVEVRAFAARIVDFSHRVTGNLALDRNIPLLILWVDVA